MLDQLPSRTSGVVVQGNRWSDVPVPALGAWEPKLTVSVVLPYYQAAEELAATLRGLAAQTYPGDLIEVIVADDGSDPPCRVVAPRTLRVCTVRHDRDGARRAAARNLGASAAGGDIVLFLDCDLIPGQGYVEAHARWHHLVPYAAVVGRRLSVDNDTLRDAIEAGAIEERRLGQAFRGRAVDEVPWLEPILRSSDHLKRDCLAVYRAVEAGQLSLRRETFRQVGGYDEAFSGWGGEGRELGWRLYNQGLLIAYESGALAWHQGLRSSTVVTAKRVDQTANRSLLVNRIPDPVYRRPEPGRSYLVPTLVVDVDADTHPAGVVVETVLAVLRNRFHDLVVRLLVSDDHPEASDLKRQFEGDGRVRIVRSPSDRVDGVSSAPLRLEVAPGVRLGPATAERLVRLVDFQPSSDNDCAVGVVHLELDATEGPRRVSIARTRALRRAEQILGEDAPAADVWRLAGELFGARTRSAKPFGISTVTAESARPHGDGGVRSSARRRVIAIKAATGWSDRFHEVSVTWRAAARLGRIAARRAARRGARRIRARARHHRPL